MKLIVIGCLGGKICYLGINKEDAIKEYIKEENYLEEVFMHHVSTGFIRIEELDIKDKFYAYDIWVR